MSDWNTWADKERSFLSDNLLDIMQQNTEYTKDLVLLNQFQNHYVFVYGTLKKDNSRGYIVTANPKNKFCGVAKTKGVFELVLNKQGAFPIALEGTGNTTREAVIKGELWLVTTSTLLKMDRIESNGNLFHRNYRRVICGDKEIPAFIYIGNNTVWRQTAFEDLLIMKQDNEPYHFFHEKAVNHMRTR